jgi:molecular chaperone HtpG
VKVNLEINPRHPVIRKLAALRRSDADKAELVAEQLLDNALIAAGLLEDPTRMIARLNRLLETV